MRIGQNPNRQKTAPARMTNIILATVTHLPALTGYHKHRFEVVQTCLRSMRDNAGGDYSVIIWDNGSCDEFREWVQFEYKPTIFVQSENIGKSAARLALFGMVQPRCVVNYGDDDIYYYPDWLKPQLEIYKTYPEVASVTGYPVRTSFRWANENTIARVGKFAKIDIGRYIPDDWEDDFAVSIGRDPLDNKRMTQNDMDVRAEYNGVQAFLTSHHCQQIGMAAILATAAQNALMYGAMPDEKPYDVSLDGLGNRLATVQRVTRHMGNVIDDDLRRDIDEAEAKK